MEDTKKLGRKLYIERREIGVRKGRVGGVVEKNGRLFNSTRTQPILHLCKRC
jgi:hypothetical protein